MKKIFLILVFLVTANALTQSQTYINLLESEHHSSLNKIITTFSNRANSYNDTTKKINKQFERWRWFWEQRTYPDGKLPLTNHYYDFDRSSKQKEDKQLNAKWSFIGPEESAGGLNGMGRVNVVKTDPRNENIFWTGAASGGLWKSTDGGNTWSTNTDDFASLGISDLVIQKNNNKIMYIATGDADAASTFSIGVLKSTDGGKSWKPTGLTFQTSELKRIYKLVMHPSDSKILYAAGNNGIDKTTDGGKTWKNILQGLFYDIEFKPDDAKTLYAVGTEFFKTTDGGNYWMQMTNGWPDENVTRVAIAVTPIAPENVYALFSDDSYGFGGFFVSTNAGYTWQNKSNSPNILGLSVTGSDDGGQGWYDLCIAVSPIDADLIYVGGINIWRSEDGGLTWKLEANWYPTVGASTVHADHHDLWFIPNSTTLFSANDGGVYRKRMNADWEWLGSGMAITQFYRLGSAASDSNKIIAGCQDNGTKLKQGNEFKNVRAGDGMECLIDYSDDNVMYASLPFGTLLRSVNNGRHFGNITPPGAYGSWVTPFLQHPENPQTLFAAMNDVYKTTDRGAGWSRISDFQIQDNKALNFIAVSKSNPDIIITGQGAGVFKKTTDGGSSWFDLQKPVDLWITSIAIHPHNPSLVYMTLSGYTDGEKVYFSSDGGTSWTNISKNLPNVPFNTIVVEENSPNRIYAGCDIGVFYLDDTQSEWVEYSDGLPNAVVSELEIHYGSKKLRAATYGRGIWQTELAPTELNTSVNGDTAVCTGEQIIYYTKSFYGVENFWYAEGGEIISDNTGDTVYVQWHRSGQAKIKLVQKLPSAGKSDSSELKVTVVERPQAIINGLDELCNKTTFTFSTDDELHKKKWLVEGGEIIGSDSGKTVNIYFEADSVAFVNLILYTELTTCTDTALKTVILKQVPKPHIQGPDTVCAFSETEYLSDYEGTILPIWKVEGGEIIEKNDKKITVQWHTQTASKVILTFVDQNTGCKDSTHYNVNVKPAPLANIDGTFNACINTKISYSTTENENLEYKWEVEGGYIDGPDTVSQIVVVWTENDNNKINLIKKDKVTLCRSDTTVDISVNKNPEPQITGADEMCLNEIVQYAVNSVDGNDLLWQVEGGEILGSNSDSLVSVKWTESGLGLVVLTMTDVLTNCSDSTELTVLINPLPNVSITGVFSVCPGCTEVYYAQTEGLINHWSVKGGELKTPPDADSAVVQWTESDNASIGLMQRNPDTDCTDSVTVNVSISDTNDTGISGKQQVCLNGLYRYTTTSSSVYKNNWTVENGIIQGDANAYSINVIWNKTGLGEVKLIQINSSTNEQKTYTKNIDISDIPPKPEITRDDMALRSSAPEGNQWYFGDIEIAGATGQYYYPRHNGKYKVLVINQAGCQSEFSDEYDFVINSYQDVSDGSIFISPNPATDYIEIIASSLAPWERARVRVYNLLGVCVLTHPLSPSREGESIRLDVSGLSPGVYFVRVGGRMYKFVKM